MKTTYPILILLILTLISCLPDALSNIGDIELLMSKKEFKELVGEENLISVDYPFGTSAESNFKL